MIGPRTARAAPCGGFTILEVLLAMAILLMGLGVILGLLSFGAALTRTAGLRTSAAQGIDAVLADLEETLFPLDADGGAGEPLAIVDRPVPGHPRLTWSASAVPNPEGPTRNGVPVEYRVDVEIGWRAGGERHVKRFTTLLLREVPFGERLRRELIETEADRAARTATAPASPPSARTGDDT